MQIFSGFILSSHSYDQTRLVIEYFVKSNNEVHILRFENQTIPFFVPQESEFKPTFKYERKSSRLKSFDEKTVDTIYLNSRQDLVSCKKYLTDNSLKSFELDVPITERFLMERFIHGNIEYTGEFNQSGNYKVFTNPEIRKQPSINNQVNFKVLSLDIETGVDNSLYSIGIHQRSKSEEIKKVYMLDPDNNYKNSEYIEYLPTEKLLLQRFLANFQIYDPDIIVGWHVVGFDLKFLENKCHKYNLKLSLGRHNSQIRINERPGAGYFAECLGRLIIDGPPTLRGNFYSYKNYKLETVAQAVLGASKDIASDENKVNEIENRFKKDKVALAKYNLLDCTLVLDIYNKLNLIDLLVKRSIISGLQIERLNISTAAMDFIYLPLLHRKGYVAPNKIDITRDEPSSGGMVLEPKQGLHQEVFVFDFKSLYPTIIQTFKIGPYSKIKNQINSIETPQGFFYSKSENILPHIISELLQQREMAKSQGDKYLSQAIKILMNSFYGILGSTKSRFYHADHPQAITTTGHYILKQTISYFEQQGHEVIYGDTDSIFVTGITSSATEIAHKINQFLTNLMLKEFQTQSYLECEFEKKFEKLYFSPARSGAGTAKKRYCGLFNDEIEFKGMENVRSDWTELAKIFQKEIYQKFFNQIDLEDYIKRFIKDLEAGFYDEYLTYTKRLSKDISEYKKNIPPHVQAAAKINYTGHYRLKEVSYVMTPNGPEPIQNNPQRFDYQHYIEKQLRPIANDLLIPMNKNFDSFISGDQLSLF